MRNDTKVLAVAVVLLLCGFTFQSFRLMDARREEQIAQANVRAALDTTRTYLVDSVQALSRLAQQGEIETDSLDDALQEALRDRNAEARAHAETRFRFDSLRQSQAVPVVDTVTVEAGGDSVRSLDYEIDGPPVEGEALIQIQPATGRENVLFEYSLTPTPFTATYVIGCAESDAVVSWSVPEWVDAGFESGRVDPVVCNPPTPGLFSIDAGRGFWFGAGVTATYLLQILSK